MTPQTTAPWAELRAIVGGEYLRPATPGDAVDRVAAQQVAEPGSAEELAHALRVADAAGLAVIPRGGGTKLGWGHPPRRADMILSTARLSRVVEHAWADMTATVQAGCTVSDFQRALAQRGQRLALDALWAERATVGGILATNDSGALRVRFGSLRDLIIGVTIALPDGTLAKSGGKVVKNVAGYDLPKLATGSLGTLGVIVEATFRLHPLPRETRSVSLTADSADTLCKLILAMLDSKLAYTGLQLRAGSGIEPRLDVRFEGTAGGIEAQINVLHQLGNRAASAEVGSEVWNARETLWPRPDEASALGLTAKFSVLPAQLSAFCSLACRVALTHGLLWGIVAQAVGTGVLRIEAQPQVPQTELRNLLGALAGLRAELEALGATLVVLDCPQALKGGVDVWGSPGDAMPLMRRVKERLDPAATLNPGRFVGGI
ncbi:MAG TPA: FAD-binding oxidoreductase [Candidatus Acidoferrales bacterium]|nr:FAD-binding oxidoreductase [Candidatus Acidoferrales bacterium]